MATGARQGTRKGAPLRYLAIADELRNSILEGDYRPGDRLPTEHELAKRFEVARTSVREALRVLSSEGLIQTTRGGVNGSVVLELNHTDVMRKLERNMHSLVATRGCSELEMEEVRELIDVTAAWMAAARRTPVHLERMRAAIPDIPPGTLPTPEQVDTNLRFHYLILEATGNRLLHLFGEPVSAVIYSYHRRREHPPEYYQTVLDDHRRILQAIEDRDEAGAREAMSLHIRHLRGKADDATSPLAGLSFS